MKPRSTSPARAAPLLELKPANDALPRASVAHQQPHALPAASDAHQHPRRVAFTVGGRKLNEAEAFADLKAALTGGLQPTGRDLVARWGISPGEVSKRLATWREAGLVTMEMRGLHRCVIEARDDFVRILAPVEHARGLLGWLLGDGDGFAAGERWPAAALYRSYEQWARDNCVLPISRQVLTRYLVAAGAKRVTADVYARDSERKLAGWHGEWLELPERLEPVEVAQAA